MQNQWRNLLNPYICPPALIDESFEQIATHYNEEGRYYHTLHHIEHMLGIIDENQAACRQPDAIKLAAWLHDVIYDPKVKDNEEKSAEFSNALLQKLGLPMKIILTTERLILNTKAHKTDAADLDTHILLDADLAILGGSAEQYQLYAGNIRKEYAWVSDEQYRNGRKEILAKFLLRPRLYETAWAFEKFEANARRNIEIEIKHLVE